MLELLRVSDAIGTGRREFVSNNDVFSKRVYHTPWTTSVHVDVLFRPHGAVWAGHDILKTPPTRLPTRHEQPVRSPTEVHRIPINVVAGVIRTGVNNRPGLSVGAGHDHVALLRVLLGDRDVHPFAIGHTDPPWLSGPGDSGISRRHLRNPNLAAASGRVPGEEDLRESHMMERSFEARKRAGVR